MNHLLLGTANPNTLYHSSVNESRTPSSSLYDRRPSQGVSNPPKTNNYLIPNNLDQRKNEQLFLRSTVSTNENVNQLIRKNKNDSFLRNHAGQMGNQSKSAKKYEQNSWSGYDGYVRSGVRPFEFKQVNDKRQLTQKLNSVNDHDNNFSNILEKLNKKEKIIKELQKLCEDRVSDNLRKGSFQQKKVENPYTVKVTGYGMEEKDAYGSSVYQSPKQMQSRQRSKNGSFRQTSYNEYNQNKNSSKIEELIPQKYQVKLYSETQVKNKNPEEDIFSKQGYNRIKASYLTPKQSKTSESRQSSRPNKIIDFKLEAEKYSNNLQIKKLKSNLQISQQSDPYQKYKYSNEPTYRSSTHIEESSSPTRKIKDSDEYTKERKNIKDIRQMMETKNIKSNTNYFSQNKVSIYDFDLKKTLGEGKFGIVYQAIHKETNSLFALKKISKKIIKENLMVDQLLQQIKIQNFCHHQNILKVYGFFDDLQFIYLILEYMEEGTLFTKLKKQKTLKQQEAAIILKQITQAVIYLHQNGIAHRDIKPQNIVMSNKVGKLCDFGWAAICTDRRKTYCGTFDYVAPEILEGSQYDISVDLWCLGVLAYQLMVGKAPFYHISRKETMKKIMNVQKTNIEFPSHLSKLAISFIQNLIKKNPEERMNGESLLKHPFLSMVNEVSL